jgi:O-acetyl-ADP-ribose deacetylase (regulator of RNase III)
MKTITGDIFELAENGTFDVIIHGCNCENKMASGLSKQVKDLYPAAFDADRNFNFRNIDEKLGLISGTRVYRKDGSGYFHIINAYTQLHALGNGVLVDYRAVRSAFRNIKNNFMGSKIAYPKIGAGKARGDWDTISKIIEAELQGEDHTLVLLP